MFLTSTNFRARTKIYERVYLPISGVGRVAVIDGHELPRTPVTRWLWREPISNVRCPSVCPDNARCRTNNTRSNRRAWGAAPSYSSCIRRRTDMSLWASILLCENHIWGKLVPMSKRFPRMSFVTFEEEKCHGHHCHSYASRSCNDRRPAPAESSRRGCIESQKAQGE